MCGVWLLTWVMPVQSLEVSPPEGPQRKRYSPLEDVTAPDLAPGTSPDACPHPTQTGALRWAA